ncbi:MAG: glutamate racemase [Clostridiales bacterium]|nr:glutamate racemase [Clostridiales bacterium]
MEMRKLPIGVFDSGVGGISVLRELAALMPNEDFIFFGDSKHAPYGTKTLEEVRKLTCADAEYLRKQQVKALVVACNTATSAAIDILREKYQDIPVIGIEPALKPAVHAGNHPRVLVMATPMTLREEKFQKLMQQYRAEAEIISLPCPGLVEFVERGELDSPALEQFLTTLFRDYLLHPVDCVVLGCTHYPLVKDMIQKVLGDDVQIFDGGEGTARETRRRLEEAGLLNPTEKTGNIQLENSLETAEILQLSRFLLEHKSNGN